MLHYYLIPATGIILRHFLQSKEEPKILFNKTENKTRPANLRKITRSNLPAAGKKKSIVILLGAILCFVAAIVFLYRRHLIEEDAEKEYVRSTYGINHKIADHYDQYLERVNHTDTHKTGTSYDSDIKDDNHTDTHETALPFDSSLAVTCHNGTFLGIREDDVISFKGIPYAVQPTGQYRWKPVPVAEEDDGVYEAYYYGRSPIQTAAESERASYYAQGEECLHLNIWNNQANPDTKKPVMVFIHGGAYGWGGTSDPIYDGQNFATAHDDVILVTIG